MASPPPTASARLAAAKDGPPPPAYARTLARLFLEVERLQAGAVGRHVRNKGAAEANKVATNSIEELIAAFFAQVKGAAPKGAVADVKNRILEDFQVELLWLHRVLASDKLRPYLNASEGKEALLERLRAATQRLLVFVCNNDTGRLLRAPTALFRAFTAGVTYFDTENGPVQQTIGPPYHRERSCGPGNQTLAAKYGPAQGNGPGERQRKRARVATCYLDRLIYDAMYGAVMHTQDLGHLHELRTTEQMFQDYFPGEGMEVAGIGLEDGTYPVRIAVTHTGPGGRRVTTEYARRLASRAPLAYAPHVHCRQVVRANHGAPEVAFEKTQTRLKEEPWLRVAD